VKVIEGTCNFPAYSLKATTTVMHNTLDERKQPVCRKRFNKMAVRISN